MACREVLLRGGGVTSLSGLLWHVLSLLGFGLNGRRCQFASMYILMFWLYPDFRHDYCFLGGPATSESKDESQAPQRCSPQFTCGWELYLCLFQLFSKPETQYRCGGLIVTGVCLPMRVSCQLCVYRECYLLYVKDLPLALRILLSNDLAAYLYWHTN